MATPKLGLSSLIGHGAARLFQATRRSRGAESVQAALGFGGARSVATLSYAALLAATFACGAAIAPGQQVLERARDMAIASRFGRLDLASQSTEPEARAGFLERRRSWGAEIRVLDIDVENVNMTDPQHAEIRVSVSWTRMGDGLLHNTTLNQKWNNALGGKWGLASEETSGDVGIFGEAPDEEAEAAPTKRDVHFATRSLGAIR